ncbi:MAG TPA: hypothetical protein VHL09_01970, partial [Dehalococcoidia bacterium]|nr:hypothetical protein [Dehalococcoidia bacterium]
TVEVSAAREVLLGSLRVRRALPRLGRRTVGAWCFADHLGPAAVTPTSGLAGGDNPVIRRVREGTAPPDRAYWAV